MNSEQFAYWLNGFAELNPTIEQPSPERWKSITEHLKTVFVKVTPEVRIEPRISFPPKQHDDIAGIIRRASEKAGDIMLRGPLQITC